MSSVAQLFSAQHLLALQGHPPPFSDAIHLPSPSCKMSSDWPTSGVSAVGRLIACFWLVQLNVGRCFQTTLQSFCTISSRKPQSANTPPAERIRTSGASFYSSWRAFHSSHFSEALRKREVAEKVCYLTPLLARKTHKSIHYKGSSIGALRAPTRAHVVPRALRAERSRSHR